MEDKAGWGALWRTYSNGGALERVGEGDNDSRVGIKVRKLERSRDGGSK